MQGVIFCLLARLYTVCVYCLSQYSQFRAKYIVTTIFYSNCLSFYWQMFYPLILSNMRNICYHIPVIREVDGEDPPQESTIWTRDNGHYMNI